MIRSILFGSVIVIAGLLSGCATSGLLIDSSHPASPKAAEGPCKAPVRELALDLPTQRTRDLLEQRQTEAMAAESEMPAQTNSKGHEHH